MTNLRLQRAIAAVVGLGVAAVAAGVVSAVNAPAPEWWRLALGFLLFFVGDATLFHLRFGRDQQSFTMSEAAIVLCLVLVPSPWMRLVAFVAVFAAHVVVRRPLVKVLFNAASVAGGAALARFVAELIDTEGAHALEHPRTWLALALGALVFFAYNGLTVATVVAAAQGSTVWSVYRKGLVLNSVVAVGNTAIGVLVVVLSALHPASVVVLPFVLGVLLALYRSYLRAIEESDVWQVLQATSRQLLRTDRDELAAVIAESSPSLLGASFVELVLAPTALGGSAVRYRSTEGGGVDCEAGDVEALAQTYWGRAVCELEPFEIDARNCPAAQRVELADLGLTSCLVAPLLAEDRVLGALRVGFSRRSRLTRRARQVFTTYANSVSGAVSNAILFAEVQERALRDPLTRMPNRAVIQDRLHDAIARAGRRGTSLAVLFLDLDRFKVINDSLGHHVGDQLLVSVAERISTTLRGSDTAGRFGGDEFVVVCEDVDEASVREVAERILAAFRDPILLRGERVFLSASIGVALADAATADAMALVRDADAAMYQAKERGRNRYEVFDADMRSRALSRLETERALREAVEAGRIEVHYQPTVDLATQQVVGAEALLRWYDPDRGFISPTEFIPIAEETGLINELGRRALRDACAQAAMWNSLDETSAPLSVAVNLSAHQLADPLLIEDVAAAIADAGVAPDLLCLEITESALLRDLDTALTTLRRLRSLGVRVALDDFGTGYSSLRYLQQLPVDVVKIDRSFVARLGADARDSSLVAGIVDLAHALGLTVVAEGVETPGQLAEVCAIGCERAQGFYFSKAQPPAGIAQLLREGARVDIAAVEG